MWLGPVLNLLSQPFSWTEENYEQAQSTWPIPVLTNPGSPDIRQE